MLPFELFIVIFSSLMRLGASFTAKFSRRNRRLLNGVNRKLDYKTKTDSVNVYAIQAEFLQKDLFRFAKLHPSRIKAVPEDGRSFFFFIGILCCFSPCSFFDGINKDALSVGEMLFFFWGARMTIVLRGSMARARRSLQLHQENCIRSCFGIAVDVECALLSFLHLQ